MCFIGECVQELRAKDCALVEMRLFGTRNKEYYGKQTSIGATC